MAADPGVLEVDGGEVVLHVTGDIKLGQSCEIVIREGSSLVIYLEGDLVASNDSSITNDSKLAKNFMLYGIGEEQNLDLKAKTGWYGAVYAPEADVTIKASADVYGSFVCRTFENMNGNFVYYDAALRDTSIDDVGASFVVARWHEE
jgi:choice-of-anchor A domain-containing protein